MLENERRSIDTALARSQRPALALIGAVQATLHRPALPALLDPASLDEQLRARALLAAIRPALAQRAAPVAELRKRLRGLERQVRQEVVRLRTIQANIAREQGALADLAALRRQQSDAAIGRALAAQDQAIRLGEAASDDRKRIALAGATLRQQANLATLPPPFAPATTARTARFVMPVTGIVVGGFGETGGGSRSRTTTLAARGGASVIAPADGIVRFAGPFLGYRNLVLLDSTGGRVVLGNLGAVSVAAGIRVRQGEALGQLAPTDPTLTVELRQGERSLPFLPLVR